MKGSYKVYAVMAYGQESATLMGVRTLKRDAEAYAAHLQKNHELECRELNVWPTTYRYAVKQTDLVCHDGANEVRKRLKDAVGKNR